MIWRPWHLPLAVFFVLCQTVLLLFVPAATAEQGVRVHYVIDGDTIICGKNQKVRLIGMDTPEMDSENSIEASFARKARNALICLVEKQVVYLEYENKRSDSYGRTLAHVFLQDNTYVNEKLLEKGLGWSLMVKPNTRYTQRLVKAQQAAMDKNLGIWKNWKPRPGQYVGNPRSKRFHARTCRHKGKKQVVFHSMWDAFYQGYSPHKQCVRFWEKW